MLHVQVFINYPTPSNCYVLKDTFQREHCIIVDPGILDCHEILNYLQEEGLVPDYILVTHEHYDHNIGCILLKELYKETKIVASSVCSQYMQEPKRNLTEYTEKIEAMIVHGADIFVEEIAGYLLWGKYIIRFFKTEGHSEGSVCFGIDNYLFTGDTLLKGCNTVTTLPGGSKEKLIDSLAFLLSLPNSDQVTVFPGHRDKFYLSEGREDIMKQIEKNKLKVFQKHDQ